MRQAGDKPGQVSLTTEVTIMAAVGDASPWGTIDSVEQYAPGIWFVTTPGHGGIKLDGNHARRMPADMIAADKYNDERWWEEDCAWSLPVIAFAPEIRKHSPFEAQRMIDVAIETAQHWYPNITLPQENGTD